MKRSTLGPVALAALLLPAIAYADQITGVTFTGSAADPTITISGSGFSPVPVPTTIAYPGFTGYDYGDQLYIQDQSSGTRRLRLDVATPGQTSVTTSAWSCLTTPTPPSRTPWGRHMRTTTTLSASFN